MSKFSEGFLNAPLLSDMLIEFFRDLVKKRYSFVEADRRLENAREVVRVRNYGYF